MLQPSALPSNPLDLVHRVVRRHPFFLGALLIHAALLGLVSHLHSEGQVEAELRRNSAQIQAHTQAAAQQGLRRRVDHLKAMKSLMERIERAQAAPDEALDTAPHPETAASQPPANPPELLAQARELRDSIQRIEQAAQAQKMAELLQLTPEQALAKVQQQAAEAARREAEPAAPQSPEQLALALERYEQQARASLQRLQAQRAQERDGTPTQSAASDTAASQQGGSAGTGGPGVAAAAGDGNARSGHAQSGGGGAGSGTTTRGPADGRRSAVNDPQARVYEGQQQSPAIPPGMRRLGSGNSLGPDGVLANRVYVDRWYLIGPFHAPPANSIHHVYPPEQWVDLDGVYLGKGRRALRWQYVSSARYPLIPPDAAEQAIYYGYTEIISDRARTVWMALGADDDAKFWLNEQLVWTSGNQRKAWYTQGGVQSLKSDIQAFNLIEERRRVHLRKGRNTLLFKLYNNPLDVFFSLVIEPGPDGG